MGDDKWKLWGELKNALDEWGEGRDADLVAHRVGHDRR